MGVPISQSCCTGEDREQIETIGLAKVDLGKRVLRAPVMLESGAVYDGEWLNGMRDGNGKQTWPNGDRYVGQWRRGAACGLGSK